MLLISGDEVFQLTDFMIKPYPKELLRLEKRIFNYRLSRARRIIENTFWIAAARFPVLSRLFISSVDVVVNVTRAVIVLHNVLMSAKMFHHTGSRYCPAGLVDTGGVWGSDWKLETGTMQWLKNITLLGLHNHKKNAKAIREDFGDF